MKSELFLRTLQVMGQGMGVILGVMLVIMALVALLNRMGKHE